MKGGIFVLATVLVILVSAFALLAVRPVPKVRAQSPSCRDSLLNSSYGLMAQGNAGPVGWDLSMLATFNGSGTFTGSHVYAVREGAPAPGGDGSFSSGTYSLGADCKFSARTNGLEVFGNQEMYLEGIAVRAGNEVIGTWYSSDGQTGTFDGKNITSY